MTRLEDLAAKASVKHEARVHFCAGDVNFLVGEVDRLREALEEIDRRTGLLIHQNTGRWDMKIEHDKRSYDVSEGNRRIIAATLPTGDK